MEEYLHINEKKTNISPVIAHYETSFVHDVRSFIAIVPVYFIVNIVI